MNTNTERRLAETFVQMLNTHDPDLVDAFIATDYRNHNAFVDDGREANRQFWAAFFAALPDLTATNSWDSQRAGGPSRCAPSTSGGSPTACSSSTGTSSTPWNSFNSWAHSPSSPRRPREVRHDRLRERGRADRGAGHRGGLRHRRVLRDGATT